MNSVPVFVNVVDTHAGCDVWLPGLADVLLLCEPSVVISVVEVVPEGMGGNVEVEVVVAGNRGLNMFCLNIT